MLIHGATAEVQTAAGPVDGKVQAAIQVLRKTILHKVRADLLTIQA